MSNEYRSPWNVLYNSVYGREALRGQGLGDQVDLVDRVFNENDLNVIDKKGNPFSSISHARKALSPIAGDQFETLLGDTLFQPSQGTFTEGLELL